MSSIFMRQVLILTEEEVMRSSFDFMSLHLDHIVGYEPMAHGVNGMEKKRREFSELR